MDGGSGGGRAARRALAAALAVVAVGAGCVDGGWGTGLPDTVIGRLPDDGAGVPDGGADLADGGADVADAGADARDAAADLPPDTASDAPPDAGDVARPACGEGPGNEKGIGKPCTPGGNECASAPTADLACDVDLDAEKGVGICFGFCEEGVTDCGSDAVCTAPADSGGLFLCLPVECT